MEIVDDVKPLSEKLRPRQLKPDEKVVLRLCSVGKKEFGREDPTAPEVYQLSGKEIITDPYHIPNGGKDFVPTTKTIGTWITENKVKAGQLVAQYKNIQFIRGYATITSQEEYNFVMRSKKNKSNKLKYACGGRRTADIFMVVEDAKEVQDQLHLEDLRWQAETIIRQSKMMPLKSIAHKMNESPDTRMHVPSYRAGVVEDNIQGMKLELIQRAKMYPKQVIIASGDDKAILTVEIHEAMNFGVLLSEKGAYSLIGKDFKVIHTPEKDENPIESLITYLMSAEGKSSYVEMTTLLKKAMKG